MGARKQPAGPPPAYRPPPPPAPPRAERMREVAARTVAHTTDVAGLLARVEELEAALADVGYVLDGGLIRRIESPTQPTP